MDFPNYIPCSPSWALNFHYSQGTAEVKRWIHSFWLLVCCQNKISGGFVLPSFLHLEQTYVLKAVAEHFLQTKHSLREHGNLFPSVTWPDFLQNSPKSFLCGFEPTWSCCSCSNSFNHSFASISGPLITSVVEAVFLHNTLLRAIGNLGSCYNKFPPEPSGTNSARHFLLIFPSPHPQLKVISH